MMTSTPSVITLEAKRAGTPHRAAHPSEVAVRQDHASSSHELEPLRSNVTTATARTRRPNSARAPAVAEHSRASFTREVVRRGLFTAGSLFPPLAPVAGAPLFS